MTPSQPGSPAFLFLCIARAMNPRISVSRLLCASASLATALVFIPAFAADPYASNNGLYPLAQWKGPYRTLNFDYPEKTPAKRRAPRRADGSDCTGLCGQPEKVG
jgi:hypothetical protein